MASDPITSCQICGETVTDYLFGCQNHCRWWLNWAETFYLTICSIICYSVFLLLYWVQFSSVVQSSPTLCDPVDCSIRPPCPSPTTRVYSNSSPLIWWCHPAISSSVTPFSSCLQSFSASGFFQWVTYSHQVAKGLEFQLQYQSFQWIFRTDFF